MGLLPLTAWPSLNIYSSPILIAALLNIALAIIVWSRSRWAPLQQAFTSWNIALALWNFGAFGMYGATDPAIAYAWYHFCGYGIVFIPGTFLWFIIRLCGQMTPGHRRLVQGTLALGFFLWVMNFIKPGFITAEVVKRSWGFGPVGGPGTRLLDPLLAFSSIYALILLRKTLQGAIGVRRNQLQLVFIGTASAFTGGAINVLSVHGAPIYPFGNVINIFYSILTTYAILSYGLLDIRTVVRRGLVYTALTGGLSAAYGLIVLLMRDLFMANDPNSPAMACHIAAIPLTLVLAPRLRSAIESGVRHISIWRSHRDETLIREFSESVITVLNLKELGTSLVDQVGRFFDTDQAVLYLRKGDQFQVYSQTGEAAAPVLLIPTELLRPGLSSKAILPGQILWEEESGMRIYRSPQVLEWARTCSFSVLLPLKLQNTILGVLALAAKRSSDMYDIGDLALLEMVSKQASVAVSNAMALERVSAQQRELDQERTLATMGTLATEMAHELARPLTRILNEQTRLHSIVHDGPAREHLKRIEREAERAAIILDGFSMLSPQTALYRVSTDIGEVLSEALIAAGLDKPQEEGHTIQVHCRYQGTRNVSLNAGQMRQVFTNIIQNACQAMPNGGDLRLMVEAPEDVQAGSMKISVEDTGPGIPVEIQKHIFEPFFTTRKAQGGRGVGLTLSLAMVERHGGTIRVESPLSVRGGTRVVVYLPLKHKEEGYGS